MFNEIRKFLHYLNGELSKISIKLELSEETNFINIKELIKSIDDIVKTGNKIREQIVYIDTQNRT